MAGIADLMKKREENKRRIAEEKEKRCREQALAAAEQVVNSDSFRLTVLNHMSPTATEEESKQQLQELATQVAKQTVAAALDLVGEFKDTCRSKGMKESNIRTAVEEVCSVFRLVEEGATYDDKLQAVAAYMKKHEDLYDELTMFT